VLPLIAAAVVAAAVAAAFIGLGDPSAACLPMACDCETVGAGPIRQPANAWSSLALAAAGVVILALRDQNRLDVLVGFAAVGSGVAAFWMHAALTSWSARLDGAGVAAITAALAVRVWSHRVPTGTALGGAVVLIGLGTAAGTPVLNGISLAFGIAAATGIVVRCREVPMGLLATAAGLIAAGGLLWWLGHSDGPWCRPDGFIVHAFWHVLAAGALTAGWLQLRRCAA
jgi:hypothetical protein